MSMSSLSNHKFEPVVRGGSGQQTNSQRAGPTYPQLGGADRPMPEVQSFANEQDG
jgi:hypothetical protein